MSGYSWVFRVAAICSFIFAAVMLVQEWLLTRIPTAATPDQILATEVSSPNMIRAWAVFLSIFCVLVAYWGVAARKLASAPALAGLGFAFCFLFAVVELSYRSVELFVVNGRWIPKYLGETDAGIKAAIRGQINAFGDVVFAVYSVLLIAHLIGSIAYGAVTWRGKGMERLVSVLFAMNAGRLLLRLMQAYGGQAWLEGLNRAIYTPIVVALLASVGVWLWSGRGDRDDLRAA